MCETRFPMVELSMLRGTLDLMEHYQHICAATVFIIDNCWKLLCSVGTQNTKLIIFVDFQLKEGGNVTI